MNKMEKKVIEYWNSTGDWRKKYYSEIKIRNWETLTDIEQKECELDHAEYLSIKMFLESRDVSRVLDIGCGVGRQLLDFGRKFPEIYFVGIDISPYQIKLLEDEIKNKCSKNIKAVVMNAADIVELNEQYEVIISCNNALGCLSEEDRNSCLKSVNKILSDDGIFLVGNFERFDIVDKCYTEWGMLSFTIDYANRIIDLGSYKSMWLSSEMLKEEFQTYGLRCFYRFEAGLGSVCAFQKIGGFNDEKIL